MDSMSAPPHEGSNDEVDGAGRLSGSPLLRLLGGHLGRYKLLLAGVIGFQLVATIASLYLPTLNADIIDKGIASGDRPYIWRTGGLMLAITLGQVVFAVAAVYAGSRVAMGFGRDVRRSLFHRVTGLSAREVGRFGAPSLITRTTNDVQQVQMLVLMSCTLLATAPITMVGGVVLALRQDLGLSALLLVSIPVLLVGVGLVIVRLVPEFGAMQVRLDSVNRVLREQLTGIRVIRAFVREPQERTRFGEANRDLTATSLRAGRLMALMMPVVLLVLNGSSVAALLIGARRIDGGQLQIGELIAFLSYLIQILSAVMMATFMAVMIPRASVSASRIQEVLDTPDSVGRADHPAAFSSARVATLELRDVGFRYAGAEAPVLAGITFSAQAGQTTAIIGSTGAGKSTLLNLVPRLFDVTAGTVRVDGHDVRQLDPDALWSRIGLVPQKAYLFSGTVASNLRLGKPSATDAELWAAIDIAQAREFVADMPGALDATILQGGANVSGGQRQRLCLARALVPEPSIFIFDDAFSALDLATEARVRAGLRAPTSDAIVLMVGQRVSSIRTADQILVLEDGVQVGLGTHDHLLRTCPTYAEIVASQAQETAAA